MEDLPPLFTPGQRLGRYELLQRLAVGGMAEVYMAFSVGPGDFRKVVAIKRLLPQHALDPQLLRMFLDEARLMARLSHPNIPHVTDVDDGTTGDVPYFVMEYVHGTDLRGILNAAAGPLPLEHALAITTAVAAGLHHAHEHRGGAGQPLEIVHRDVSPSNVLISFDGGVKITDFGVAKWTEQKSFTHQGQLKGKFAHMSPEQCRGETLDRRSDVFALGTLLYEMTTGHPPFIAESEYDLLSQIVSRDASPPRRPGEIYPAQLESIVLRSLRRDRGDRYPTTQSLQLDLEAFAREHRLVVSPVSLAGYIESLFGARVTEWRQAMASGKTLADHLGSGPASPRQGRAKAERTETDAFAPSLSRIASGIWRALTPMASPAQSSPGLEKRRAARTAAIVAASVAGLAALLVATEMTSSWQRASQSALTPLGRTGSFPSPAVSLPPGRPVDEGSPSLGRASTHPSPPAPAPSPADPGAIGTAKVTLPATRRGRETATRLARREAATTTPPSSGEPANIAGAETTSPAKEKTPPVPGGGQLPVEPLPMSAPAPIPAATTTRAPSPSIRVWDPDSPVPP